MSVLHYNAQEGLSLGANQKPTDLLLIIRQIINLLRLVCLFSWQKKVVLGIFFLEPVWRFSMDHPTQQHLMKINNQSINQYRTPEQFSPLGS